MERRGLTGALGLLLVAAGCEPRIELKPGDPELVRAARQLFDGRCANCHGPRGRGDGPAGRALSPRPRDFGDAAWQASVDDARLRQVIVGGGAAVGLSSHMQSNPDLADSPVLVGELIRIVRACAEGQGAKDMSPETAKQAP
ncbi:c-type cytochrome [Nannocystis bainbridge]|uniref:C-type cytochrome n=1 Tax=Nannocystis bainbridge TaxID=2995303 RepID=A0ABT5E0Z1_9BACT|nr:c-type cytochrome [Nannocystis bainbridge]MDC0719547.1 c-type cytochrome [Nannocystis bainbridge]